MLKDQPENNALPSWANKKANLVEETEEILDATAQKVKDAKQTIAKFSAASGSGAAGGFFNADVERKEAYEKTKAALENADKDLSVIKDDFSNSLTQKSSIGLSNGSSGSYAEDASAATIKVSA